MAVMPSSGFPAGVWSMFARMRFAVGLLIESALDGITAFAGGGQTSATQLNNEINRVTTVATIGDSVMLPQAKAGLSIAVINSGANSAQVFGNGADTINGVAAATGVAQMANSATLYMCP